MCGLDGAAWKSQRCREYSMSCHSSMPAAASAASDRSGSTADARTASSAATGSQSSGTTHLHVRQEQKGGGVPNTPSTRHSRLR